MADETPKNIYMKINEIRDLLLEKISKNEIKKTGKGFRNNKFFSLDDIVAPIQKAMSERNLYHEVNISDKAILNVINLDNMEEVIEISFPIPSSPRDMAEIGSSITYSRRYLYYLLFNISDVDDDFVGTIEEEKKPHITGEVINVEEIPSLPPVLETIKDSNTAGIKLSLGHVTIGIKKQLAEGNITKQEADDAIKFVHKYGVGVLV